MGAGDNQYGNDRVKEGRSVKKESAFRTTVPPVHTTWRDFLFYVRNGSYLCSVK
jgi:hypothetical protein